jgi:hypothetical protein
MKRWMVGERRFFPCSVHQRSMAAPKVCSGASLGSGSRPNRCRSCFRDSSSSNRRASVLVRAVVALSRHRPRPSLNRTYHRPFFW